MDGAVPQLSLYAFITWTGTTLLYSMILLMTSLLSEVGYMIIRLYNPLTVSLITFNSKCILVVTGGVR